MHHTSLSVADLVAAILREDEVELFDIVHSEDVMSPDAEALSLLAVACALANEFPRGSRVAHIAMGQMLARLAEQEVHDEELQAQLKLVADSLNQKVATEKSPLAQ